jgi:hypothetical protein
VAGLRGEERGADKEAFESVKAQRVVPLESQP